MFDLRARMSRRKRIAARVRLFLAYGLRGRAVVRDEIPERRRVHAVKR